MGARIRLLNLFNLDEIIEDSAKRVHSLRVFGQVSNKRDLLILFIYFVFDSILKVYKENSGFITFYLSAETQNLLLQDGGIIEGVKCKKLHDLLTKKIKFPLIVSFAQFHDFCSLMSSNCPEYDELLERYKFMGELLPQITKEAKKLKFSKFAEELEQDIQTQLSVLNFKQGHKVH